MFFVTVKTTLEICILAGGLSSRMGRDKARVRLGGKSLVARVKGESRRTGWPVRVVRKDAVKRCGPLGGIYTGLKTAKADAVIFLACDMPFVSAELIERVGEALSSKYDAAFTKQAGRVGFPFALRTNVIGIVEKQIEGGDFSIQMLARRTKGKFVRAKSSDLFDLDTPPDLAEARNRAACVSKRLI